MRPINYLVVGGLAVAVLAACSDSMLEVTNPNNPDRGRVLGNPADVEALAGSQFQGIIAATLGDIARVNTGLMTASFENASTLANNGLGPRSGIPRQPIDNNRGNAYQSENYSDFRRLSSVARNCADVLLRAKANGFALGAGRDGDVIRLKAWTHFAYGVALGYLSLVYDSAGIPRPDDALGFIPALEDYKAVNTYALAQFDSALAYANMSGATALPSGWLTGYNGPTVTVADFIRTIRSFKAKMRAGVARTPAERAAADWNAVIADATAGITADFVINYNPSYGWDHNWMQTGCCQFRDDPAWHQMTPYIIGMADTTRAYDAWLAVPRDQRVGFLIRTPDLRFPQGETRAAQNAVGQGAPTGKRYFRNRSPGLDQAATGWQQSYYDHYRFRAFGDANRVGPKPFLTKAENDMLAAEGYIRQGNIAAAAALIDKTRTYNGLPALTGAVSSANDPVPGGNACVPRVAVGPTFTTTACGNIMEAMKWEKRMETAYTTYGSWFFDSRGWGDMPIGTPVQWPVPVDEMDARVKPFYNMGGNGLPGGAAASTYGIGTAN